MFHRNDGHGAYRYNHGKKDASTPWAGSNCYRDLPPVAEITGAHRLHGDGSVLWRQGADYATDRMHTPSSYPEGYVLTSPSPAVTHYY